ncbi:tRNA (guanine-N1)-methyltransferase [Cyanobacteria bacterium FACHB-502]|nr:tRNA (guanine-N1)-methyltransferase [Cyanobacteria bacterium FACHB-502]
MTVPSKAASERNTHFYIGNAFYRPQSRMVRDLGVLAAAVYRQQTGRLRVLDAMAGSGIRSLRYFWESGANDLWINDSNPEMSGVLQQNLSQIPADRVRLTNQDANRVFFECYRQQDFYDLVDVDAFGSPAPYLSTSLWAVALGGLLYLTSTDGRSASGSTPDRSLAAFGAYARSHPAAHEQGLRLLIGAVQQSAAAKGFGVVPVFSLFAGESYRVMVRLVPSIQLNSRSYGFLGYCHTCGDYQTIAWEKLGRIHCPHDRSPLSISGAMWLSDLHDANYVAEMKAIAQERQWSDCIAILETMQAESSLPPYFYTLREIGRRGKLNLPNRSHLIQTLQSWGYAATPTHINPQALKTTAPFSTCLQAAQL